MTQEAQQNKKYSEVQHYEFRFYLHGGSHGFYDEMSFICAATSLCEAETFFNHFVEYHELPFLSLVGWRYVSKDYRKKAKAGD